MADKYVPSAIVKKLAAALMATAIAEAMHEDGVLVIVFEDGRKLRFTKDDIARTLAEPASSTPEADPSVMKRLDDVSQMDPGPGRRKQKGSHGQA